MELIRGVIAGRGRNVGVGNRLLLFLVFLDANSQMGPGIGLIFVAAAIRLLDRKKRLMSAPPAVSAQTLCKSTCICMNGPGACPRGFLLCPNAC